MPLVFGDFELDPARSELRRGGEPVELLPTPLRLLQYLVEHRDRAVPKHELLDSIWPDTAVSETALTSALKHLRKALGDDGTRQAFIRTQRRHGIRFVADVEEIGEPDSAVSGTAAPPDDRQRRLAAILSADVVGYSRRLGEDEARTVAELDATRARIQSSVESEGGRVVDAVGDNVLAELPSAVAAVNAALEIQRLGEPTEAEEPEPWLQLRIGLHMGEVLADGARLYGDAVNVAARLEPLAPAGGLCVSAAIAEALAGKLSLDLEDLGERTLKNIVHGVHAYRHPTGGRLPEQPTTGADPQDALHTGSWTPASASGRPVVAVLAFANRTGQDSHEESCLTLSEDLTATLAQFSSIAVVSSDRSGSAAAIARELGADFFLTGSLRGPQEKFHLRIQLATARDERIIWSDTIQWAADSSSSEVAGALASRSTPVISKTFASLAQNRSNADAWGLVILAESALLFSPTGPNERDRVVDLCAQARKLAPDLALAWALSSGARISHYTLGYGDDPDLELADSESARALELSPSDPTCLYFRAVYFGYSGDPTAATRLLRRCLEAHPTYAQAHAQLGYHLGRLGLSEEAMTHMERAKILSPRDPRLFLWRFWEAMIHIGRRDWECALTACIESIDAHRRNPAAWLAYISVLVARGALDDARQAAGDLRKLEPNLDETRLRRILGLGVAANPRFVDGAVRLYRSVGLL